MKINNEIKAETVRVISDNKEAELMTLSDAISIAEENGEDVICLREEDIPICKIYNYKKFMYEKNKKEKDNRKKARLKSADTKIIQLRDSTAEHDLRIKAKNITRILEDGDRVKAIIQYKGRSIRLIETGKAKLEKLISFIGTEYKIDSDIKIDGNTVTVVLAPVNQKRG